MSFFRFPVLKIFSEISLWLRISRVSQPQKNAVPKIFRENLAILAIIEKSANSQSTFNSAQKKNKSLLPKNLTHGP